MRARWSERKQDVADVAMALAIAVEAQVEAWTAPAGAIGSSPHVVGPRPALAASYLVVSLALVARRRRPVGVLVVVAVQQALDPSYEKATDPLGAMPFLVLLVLLPWVSGMYIRTRRLYVAELRERADRAEAEREARARAAVADEQQRIARELHDAVAHAMSVMVIQAEAAEEMLDGDPERARLPVQRVQRVGREGLAEMRRLLGVLRSGESPGTAPQPGLSRLGALADEVGAAGLPVALTVEGAPGPVPVGRRTPSDQSASRPAVLADLEVPVPVKLAWQGATSHFRLPRQFACSAASCLRGPRGLRVRISGVPLRSRPRGIVSVRA